jgi:hypothetical protein
MANEAVNGLAGHYRKTDGAGSVADPFIEHVVVDSIGGGTTAIGTTKDGGPSQTITRTYTASADLTTAAAITAAPTSGQKIVLMDVLISVSVATVVTLEMETSANVLAGFHMPANSTLQITPRGWIKGDAADKKIFAKSTVAGAVKFTAVYFSEA